LARSHALAREFLQLAQAHSRTLVTYETAALERLLLTVPRPRLDAFVAEQIGPLQAADASGRRQLVQTLEAYVVSGSAAEAARRLYIHYNTMKYRLAQIGELLQVDLSDAEQRLALALAIKVMRQTVPRPTPTPGS
jgi:DNA-binding PucR family transcriptional regulator